MARRLILDTNGLHISAPGYDAASATGSHLLFDSSTYAHNAIYLSGTAAPGVFSESKSQITATQLASNGDLQFVEIDIYTRTCTIGFGKTFNVAPRYIVGVFDPEQSSAWVPSTLFGSRGESDVAPGNIGYRESLRLNHSIVSTSDIQLTLQFFCARGASPSMNRFVSVSYLIFQT